LQGSPCGRLEARIPALKEEGARKGGDRGGFDHTVRE
jgi:hypothetical protein